MFGWEHILNSRQLLSLHPPYYLLDLGNNMVYCLALVPSV